MRFLTADRLYLVNPLPATLAEIPSGRRQLSSCTGFTFWQISDTSHTNFEMATNFADGIIACSDLALSQQFLPDVPDTETWSVMALHELFHQYQSNHPPFRERAIKMLKNGQYLGRDSLSRIFKQYPAFGQAAREENELLLLCLQTTQPAQLDSLLYALLSLREKRLASFRQQTGMDISAYENFEQIAEGGARFMEYHYSRSLGNFASDKNLAAVDTAYHSHKAYRKYSLEKEGRYLYTLSSQYFYALGFNSIRLLDKLGVPFRDQCYADPQYSFTKAFQTYLQSKKKD